MFQKLLQQFKTFSRENWWIYLLLVIALWVVVYTWKGNVYEVLFIFLFNLSGAMCNMLMMSSYKDKNFIEWSIFIITANTLYTFLSLYAWIYNGDMQYIYWQASFILTGIKAFMYYTYEKDLKYINFWSILCLNIVVMFLLVFQVWISWEAIIQSLGIAGITLGLSLTEDMKRYFYILAWNTLVVLWTFLILAQDYIGGEILGITVAYALLGLSICSYNYRILPEYLRRIKQS